MAILKYTNANGDVVSVNSYKVNNVLVKSEKGESEADVMSQKVVSDLFDNVDAEIEEITSNIAENTQKIENVKDTISANKITTDSAINAVSQEIANVRTSLTDVYTKSEIDAKETALSNAISEKAAQSDLEAEISRATARENELFEEIQEGIDCGYYDI